MRRLLRDWLAVLALAVVVLSVLAALGAPLIPGDPYDNDLSMSMQPPSAEHWLGADDQGRDMVVRVIYGLRLTLLMGAVSVVAGGGIGTALGLFAAFYRRIDGLVMRCMDVLLSFPAILFGLAIAAIAGPGVTAVILALTVATIPLAARIVRGVAVGEMARDYIEAARATGLRDSRLIVKHLLPNCFSALSVWATLRFGQVILLGAALSFVGLGAQPPTAELGAMAAAGRNFLFFAPHIAIIPSVAIFVIVLAFNVLGDALRDLLDPRLRNLGD
jgi:peptide/nickel transport system permease protein